MTGPLLAGLAAALGVLAAWSALGAADHGLGQVLAAAGPDGRLAKLLAPLRAGRATTRGERHRLLALAAAALLAGGSLLARPPIGLALGAAAPPVPTRVPAAA